MKKNSSDLDKLAYSIGKHFYRDKKYNSAIKYAKYQINLLEDKKLTKSAYYQKSLHYLGLYFMLNNEFDNALFYLKKSSNLDFSASRKAKSLCEIGNCFRMKGDYRKSINYHIKGIKLFESLNKPSNIISNCINIVAACNQIHTKKDLLLGIYYLNKADSILQANPKSRTPSTLNLVDNGIATLYSSKHIFDLKKSKKYYSKTLKRAYKNKNPYFKTLAYMNLGDLYLKIKNDSALYFLKKSLSYSQHDNIYSYNKDVIGTNTTISEIYRNIALYYSNKSNFKKALKNIQKSINISFFIDSDSDINPTEIQLLKTNTRRNIVKALKTKIQILLELYKKAPTNNSYLSKIINIVNIGDRLVKLNIDDNTEKETNFLWRNDVSQIYFFGGYASHLMNDYDKMFSFFEKNKAFLLIQDIKTNNEKLKLPNNIVKRDLLLRKRIINITNSNKKEQLRDSIFNSKLVYQKFTDSIKKKYPQYFENRNNIRQTSLNEIQKIISSKDIVISFNFGLENINTKKQVLLALLTSKNKSISFKIENDTKFINYLTKYRNLISKPLHKKEQLENFKEAAFYLYKKLFPTQEIKNLIKGNNLIIISDNTLQNIPFESLTTKKDSLKYLVETTNISYAYSISFLEFNKNIKRTNNGYLSSFAPIEFKNDNLTSLINTEKEISSISNILKSNIYIRDEATKEHFLNKTSNASIIHLSTHATANNKPTIYFKSDSLNLNELYTYKNNADLVVLSACQTNLGEIKKGEGVLSLARGFFYSGANSVISSLWNINDASSSYLIKNFYSNLINKQTKSEALNNAKRKYLQEHSLSEKSPYYWASFVLIGDTSQTFKHNYFNYFLVGFSILIIYFLFFLKKRG